MFRKRYIKVPASGGKAACLMLMIMANVAAVLESRRNYIEEDETKEKERNNLRGRN